MPPREMIDNSWKWARANGKIRVHPVHGKEEARLVLTDWFEDKKETGEERSTRGNATVQDHNGILASFLPYSLLCLDHLGPPASRLQPLPQDEGEVLMDDDVQPALDPPLDPEQAQEIAKAAAAHSGGKGKLLAMYMGISCFFFTMGHFSNSCPDHFENISTQSPSRSKQTGSCFTCSFMSTL